MKIIESKEKNVATINILTDPQELDEFVENIYGLFAVKYADEFKKAEKNGWPLSKIILGAKEHYKNILPEGAVFHEASVDGKFVGGAIAWPGKFSKEEHVPTEMIKKLKISREDVFYFEDIIVAEEQRGKGIGKQLADARFQELQKKDSPYKYVVFRTDPDNQVSPSMYEKNYGFRQMEIDGQSEGGNPKIYFYRNIQGLDTEGIDTESSIREVLEKIKNVIS